MNSEPKDVEHEVPFIQAQTIIADRMAASRNLLNDYEAKRITHPQMRAKMQELAADFERRFAPLLKAEDSLIKSSSHPTEDET